VREDNNFSTHADKISNGYFTFKPMKFTTTPLRQASTNCYIFGGMVGLIFLLFAAVFSLGIFMKPEAKLKNTLESTKDIEQLRTAALHLNKVVGDCFDAAGWLSLAALLAAIALAYAGFHLRKADDALKAKNQ
jgi:hypothetical protein